MSKSRKSHALPLRTSRLLRFFGLLGLLSLFQSRIRMGQEAFCQASVGALARSALVSRAAQAKSKEDPVKELQRKLTEVLGKNLTKNDIIWRYQASLELPCLQDFSTTSVGQVTFDGSNSNECRRKAAAAMLAALDFEQLAAESKKTSKKPEKNKSQTANEGQTTTDKKKPNIGDELEGKVTAKTSRGLRMNVAGNEAFLLASELCDGFPEDVPKLGSTFQVRVLQNKKLLQVTRREGSLERQSYSDLKFDASVLQDLDPSSKVEAEVIGFDFTNAFLKIVSPSDPSKMTLANLPRKDFAEGAEKEIRIGSKIQVRRKYSKRGRDIVSMREQPDRQPKDLNVGDTLTGTVDSILQGLRPAIFLDVGFDRPAYMDWQECGEGHNATNFRSLKRGQSTSVRVLAVQGDRIYVTRRPGDLHRASLDGSGRLPKNTPDIMSKFMALPLEQELEGKVYRLYPRYASIAVKSPDGDTADGYLGIDYFSKSFIQEAAPGLTVAVRRLPKQNAEGPRLMLTMQSSSTAGGSNEQADTLQEDEPGGREVLENKPAPVPDDEAASAAPDSGPLEGLKDFLMR